MVGVNLHATLDGPADAPTLLLANSLGTTSRVWDAQFSALARHFRLVRFDHRGHGESWSPPGPWSIADLGRDVLALLDELGIERASFAGLSIGGMVGMWLAANAPQRVDRLVLVCTSAHPDAEQAWRQRATRVRASGMAAIADAVVARWFTPQFAARQPQQVADYTDMLAAIPAQGYAQCCEALATLDLRAELAAVRAATLVIAGACDLAIPPAHGKRIADAVRGARFLVVDDAAHIAPVEQPEQLTRALLDHLLPDHLQSV
jgi:3-oxoadipate enol-lactonase